MDAKRQYVRKAQPEFSNADFPVGQNPGVSLELDEPLQRTQIIETMETPLEKEYAEALRFAEEPVTIYIHPSGDKNPPLVVDCWVNGRGAEVFVNGEWHVFNCLPVGKQVTTRRKYVEVLARSKIETINTQHEDATVERPKNILQRSMSSRCTFQIIGDDNPKGREWIRRLMADRA